MPAAGISTRRILGAATLSTHENHISHPGCSFLSDLMFPDSETKPAGYCKPFIGIAVAGPIDDHLPSPIIDVCSGDCVVFWTAVPEAAVEKNRDAFGGKDQVGGAAETLDRCGRDSIPKTEPVHRRAQGNLGLRITPPVGAHACAHPFGRSPGTSHLPMLFRHASGNDEICRWLSLA
jgi:hypothetical protein